MTPGGGLWTPENQIKSPSDLFSFSHIRNASRLENSRLGALRTLSARPQGIWATVGEQVGRSSNSPSPFPSPHLEHQEHASDSDSASLEIEAHARVGRIGIGLPMSNIFATWVSRLICWRCMELHLTDDFSIGTLGDLWSWCL